MPPPRSEVQLWVIRVLLSKVFADQNRTPAFYKDGCTDLRGKFDYASLSTGYLDSSPRFSVLIMSDTHGTTVKEVQPPKR